MIIKDQYVFALGDNKENAIHVNQGEVIEFVTFKNYSENEALKMAAMPQNITPQWVLQPFNK